MTDARSQMLASALGIAGPSPALGTLGEQPPIAWLTLPNDRPIGPQQGSIPLSIQIRADFAPALQAAIQALHDQGCALPLLSPLQVLPPATAAVPTDLLPLIGRTIWLAPGQALVNPDTDALAVAQLAARPLASGESSRERRTDTGRAASVECADMQRLGLHGLAAAGWPEGPMSP